MVSSLLIKGCTEAGINIRHIFSKANPETLMRPRFMPTTSKMCSLHLDSHETGCTGLHALPVAGCSG